MTNEELLLDKLNPELKRIWNAVKIIIEKYEGTGDIEVHMYKGKIKIRNGVYIKPSFSDEEEFLKEVQK